MGVRYVGYIYYAYPEYIPNPTYQLTVISNPQGLPVSGSGQYCLNQTATASVNSTIVQVGPGTRYVFTGWSGDYSGTSPSGQLTITGSKTVVANFKIQYLLTVNSAHGNPSGSGWYDVDSVAFASLDATIVDVTIGVRFRFAGWAGDAVGQSIPTSVKMSGPKTVTAQWKPQYYVSVGSTIGQAAGSGWYDEGSAAIIRVDSPVPAGYGSQYVFDKWTGTTEQSSSSAQIVVDKPITLTATWHLDQTVLDETIAVVSLGVIAAIAVVVWLAFVRRRPTVQISDEKESVSDQDSMLLD